MHHQSYFPLDAPFQGDKPNHLVQSQHRMPFTMIDSNNQSYSLEPILFCQIRLAANAGRGRLPRADSSVGCHCRVWLDVWQLSIVVHCLALYPFHSLNSPIKLRSGHMTGPKLSNSFPRMIVRSFPDSNNSFRWHSCIMHIYTASGWPLYDLSHEKWYLPALWLKDQRKLHFVMCSATRKWEMSQCIIQQKKNKNRML